MTSTTKRQSETNPEGQKEAKVAKTEQKPNSEFKLQLGPLKYLTVSKFKGSKFVNIRKYYLDKNSGEEKPGKEGLALTPDQFKVLLDNTDQINAAIDGL